MAWNSLKDPESILKTISEYNSMGREAFLNLYGYDQARRYFLEYEGRHYDSKAILGVAHKFEFPRVGPLKPSQFAGGNQTVKRHLERLGFTVHVVGHINNSKKAEQSRIMPGESFDPAQIEDARKKILREITARRGQAQFRDHLIEVYSGKCTISGCDVVSALEAAHIHPYKGENTNVIQNGLLLRADLHTLFDLGFIGIDPDKYTVLIAPQLKGTFYQILFETRITLPSDSSLWPARQLLLWHAQEFDLL